MATTDARPPALVVTGPPACGKSTVGAALAARLGAALIDVDVVTQPLVGVIGSLVNVHDLDDQRLAALTRPARYDSITRVAEDNLRAGNAVVLVAPFTLERQHARAWEALSQRLHTAGAGAVTMIWLYLDRDELLRRMRARAAERDVGKLNDEDRFLDRLDLTPPVGPHVPIDAGHPIDDIVRSVVAQLESGSAVAHASD